MEPTTEEIVKSLRGCKAGTAGGCRDCLMREKSGCINALHDAAADRLEELEDALNVLETGLLAINNRLMYIGAVKAETSVPLPEPPKEE